MEPKTKLKGCHVNVGSDLPAQNLGLKRTDVAVEKSVGKPVEAESNPASDPNYPSREILLAVADKLLKLFEKR